MTDERDTGAALRALYEPSGGVRAKAAEASLRDVFDRFARNSAVNVRYQTVLFLGRPS